MTNEYHSLKVNGNTPIIRFYFYIYILFLSFLVEEGKPVLGKMVKEVKVFTGLPRLTPHPQSQLSLIPCCSTYQHQLFFPFWTLQTPRQNPTQAHTEAAWLFKITPSYPLLQKEGNNISQSMVYTILNKIKWLQ